MRTNSFRNTNTWLQNDLTKNNIKYLNCFNPTLLLTAPMATYFDTYLEIIQDFCFDSSRLVVHNPSFMTKLLSSPCISAVLNPFCSIIVLF